MYIIIVVMILLFYLFYRELPDHSVEMIDTFLASIVESEKSKEKRACRGPFIAQLELHKLLIELEEACICSTTQQCKFLMYVLQSLPPIAHQSYSNRSCFYITKCTYRNFINKYLNVWFLMEFFINGASMGHSACTCT